MGRSRRLAILTTLVQRKSTLQEPELSLGGGLSVELVWGARAGGIESWSCEDTLELSLKPKPKQP